MKTLMLVGFPGPILVWAVTVKVYSVPFSRSSGVENDVSVVTTSVPEDCGEAVGP